MSTKRENEDDASGKETGKGSGQRDDNKERKETAYHNKSRGFKNQLKNEKRSFKKKKVIQNVTEEDISKNKGESKRLVKGVQSRNSQNIGRQIPESLQN